MKKLAILLGAAALVAGCNKNDDVNTTAGDGSVYRESAGAQAPISDSSITNLSTNGTNSNVLTNDSQSSKNAPSTESSPSYQSDKAPTTEQK